MRLAGPAFPSRGDLIRAIGGVRIAPGDYVVADHDGVVVVPGPIRDDVLERAEALVQTENKIREAVRAGIRGLRAVRCVLAELRWRMDTLLTALLGQGYDRRLFSLTGILKPRFQPRVMPLDHFATEWGNPGSYSQAGRFADIIFTCGQAGGEPGGPAVDFDTQARTALKRLVSVGGVDTIIRINGCLASMVYDRVYREIIGVEPKPACTTVQIGSFVPPLLVEADAVAVVREAMAREPS